MDAEPAFQKIVTGVHVISVKSGDAVNAMTAAWVTRVSHVPPLVMVSVAHTRFSHDLIRDAKAFCVNVLAEDQADLSSRFGFESGKDKNKFEGLQYEVSETGSPVLSGIAAYLDCRLVSEHEAGDHTLFVGEVVAAEAFDKEPLTYP